MEVGSVSIELGLERSKFDRGINQVSNTKLAPIDANLRLDSKAFNRQLTELKPIASVALKADTRALQNQLKSLNTQVKLNASVDTRSARLTIKELSGIRVDVRLRADTSALQKQLSTGLTSKISLNADSLGVTDGITKAIEKGFEKARPKTNILGSLFGGIGSIITSPLKGALQGAFLGIGTPLGEQLGKGISKAVQQSLGATIGSVELFGEKGFLKSLAGLQQIPGILESVFDGTPIVAFVKTAQKQFEALENTLDKFNVTLRPKKLAAKVVSKQEVAVESSAKSFDSQQGDYRSRKKASASARADFLSMSEQRANIEEIDKQITARQQELQKYLKLINEIGSKIERGKADAEDKNIFAQASAELEGTTKNLEELQRTKEQYFAKLKDQIEILAELGVGGDLSKEALDLVKLQETFQTLKTSQQALQESRKGLKTKANTPEAIRVKKLEKLKSNAELSQAALTNELSSPSASTESVQKAKKRAEATRKALELFQIEIANPAKEIEIADKKLQIATSALAETLQKLESVVSSGLVNAFEAASQEVVKVSNLDQIKVNSSQAAPQQQESSLKFQSSNVSVPQSQKVAIPPLQAQPSIAVPPLQIQPPVAIPPIAAKAKNTLKLDPKTSYDAWDLGTKDYLKSVTNPSLKDTFKALKFDQNMMATPKGLLELQKKNNLSDKEIKVIQAYTMGPYRLINAYLRDSKKGLEAELKRIQEASKTLGADKVNKLYGGDYNLPIEDLEKYISTLAASLQDILPKLPNHEGVVFRGEGAKEDLNSIQQRLQTASGSESFTAPAFTSSGVEEGFAGKVQYAVKSKSGKMVQIPGTEGVDKAGEVLHGAGSHFKITAQQSATDELKIPESFSKAEAELIKQTFSPEKLKQQGAEIIVFLEEVDKIVTEASSAIQELPPLTSSPKKPATYEEWDAPKPSLNEALHTDNLQKAYTRGAKLSPKLSKKYGLTADDQASLAAYTATGLFDSINNFLRGGTAALQKTVAKAKLRIEEKRKTLTEEQIQQRLLTDFPVAEGIENRMETYADGLSSALSKIPASEKNVVFRGDGSAKRAEAYTPGNEHTFPAFTSVSEQNPFSAATQLVILPKNAKDITGFAPLANIGKENGGASFGSELLLDRGTKTNVLFKKELSLEEKTGQVPLDLSGIKGLSEDQIKTIQAQYTPEFIKKSGTEILVVLEEVAREVQGALDDAAKAVETVKEEIQSQIPDILNEIPVVDLPLPTSANSQNIQLNSSQDTRKFVKENLNAKGTRDLARRMGIDTKNSNKEYLTNEISSLAGTHQGRQQIAGLVSQLTPDNFLSSSKLKSTSTSQPLPDAAKAIADLKKARKSLAEALKKAETLDGKEKQEALEQIIKSSESQQAIAKQLSSEHQLSAKESKSLGGTKSQLSHITNTAKQSLSQSQNPASMGSELGSNLVDAIGVGMKNEAKTPIKTIKSVMQQIQVAAETQAEIKSPSRVFKRIGRYLTEGLAVGIEQGKKIAEEAMSSILTSLSSGTGEISFEDIGQVLKGVIDDLNQQTEAFDVKLKISEDIQTDNERKTQESSPDPDKRDDERENIRRRAGLSSKLERNYGMEGLAPEILPDRIQNNGAKLENSQSIFQGVKNFFKSIDNSLVGRLKKRASQLALEVDTAIAPSLETSAIDAGQRGDKDSQKQYKKLAKQGRAAASGIAKILESPEITEKQAKRLQRLTEQLERVYDTIGRPLPSQGFIESLGLQTTGIFKNLGGLIKGFLAFSIGSWTQSFFSSIAQNAFKAFVEVDRLKTAINFSSGSKAAGARNLQFVNQTSEDLGIPLKQSQEGFSGLNAAARRTALEGQGVKDLFLGMAQASTVLSLSNEQNQRGFTALTQILSKGKASAEEMRQQLAESGLTGAMGIAARATVTTEEEFNRLLESGQIISQDFLPKFAKQLQAEFGDAAQDASGNAQSAIYKFENAYLSLQQGIGEGVAPAAMVGLNTLASLLKSVAAIGKELAIIIGAVSVALLFNLGKALYATISNIILTKAATGTLGGALGSLASTLNNSLSAKIAVGFGAILEIVNLLSQAINTNLIQSFDDSARAAKRAAEESAKYFEKPNKNNKDNKGTTPQSSSGVGRFVDDFIINPLNWDIGPFKGGVPFTGKKFKTWGEYEAGAIRKKIDDNTVDTDSFLSDARVRMAELKSGKGKAGQLPGIDSELQQAEQARQVLQAQMKRDFTNKGRAVPAELRQQLESQNLKIQNLNTQRADVAKPVTRDLAEADRQISSYKAQIENLKSPEAIAAIGGAEAADKEKEKLQLRLDNVKKYKAEIEATLASLKVNPVLAFTNAIRQLNLTFAEQQEKNQLNFDARKAQILKQQSTGFSSNKFNSRETGLKLAFEEQKKAYADLQNAQASANQFDAEMSQASFQSTLQRLGVSPDASAAKIDDLLKNTSDEADKNILEKLKAGREQKNKLSEARATVEESNFKVKSSSQDLTLAQFQDSQANQQAALQRAEASKLSAVKTAQQARLISESEAAEKLARIQLGSTQQQQKNIASQLAALKLYHAQGGISAEEFNTRQRELTNQQTDLEKQATDQRLAVFEAGNRRRLEQIELANKKAEAVINLSQTNRTTAVKEKVLDGAISPEQAAQLQNKIDQDATNESIANLKRRIEENRRLRQEGTRDAKTADDIEIQLNQDLAKANQQAIDQQIQGQQNLRDAIDKTFQRRKAQLDLEKSNTDVNFEAGILSQLSDNSPKDLRGTELNNKSTSLNNERADIEKQASLINDQIAGLDKLNLSTEQYNDRRTQLETEFNQLSIRYLKNQQEQITTKREIEINGIERARASEENRHKRLISQLDEQKSKLDLINQSLELTSKLNQSRFDLSKALSDATVAPLETKKSNADRALELSKRLDDKDLDPRVKGEVKNQLNTLGFGTTELEILNQRAQIEDEIAAKKLEALKIEQAFQRKSLELDLQRQAIAAQMAIYDAEGAQLAAQKSKIEAESALRTAKVKGDDLAIKSAEISIELAEKESALADKKLEAATNGANAQSELAKNAVLTQEVTQRTAVNQQLAADGARKQAQSMERVDAIAKNSARNKTESSATGAGNSAAGTGTTPSDWENPYIQKKGEGLFEYHSRLNQARMQGKLVETNVRKSVVEDNILTSKGIVPNSGTGTSNSSKLQAPKTSDEILKSALGGTEQRLDSLISLFSEIKNVFPSLALDNLNLAPLEKNLFNPLALPTEPKMQDWRSTSLINLGNGASYIPPIDRTAEIANSAQIQPGVVQQQTVDAVSFAFTQKFDTLSAAIMQVAGMPRSLTVQSNQPVDDAASIWNDFAAAKVGAAGL